MIEVTLHVFLRNFASLPPDVLIGEEAFQHFVVEYRKRSVVCYCSIKHADSHGPMVDPCQLDEMRRILRIGQDLRMANMIEEYFISCYIIMTRKQAEFEIPLDLMRLFAEFPDLPSFEIEVEYIRNGVAP